MAASTFRTFYGVGLEMPCFHTAGQATTMRNRLPLSFSTISQLLFKSITERDNKIRARRIPGESECLWNGCDGKYSVWSNEVK